MEDFTQQQIHDAIMVKRYVCMRQEKPIKRFRDHNEPVACHPCSQRRDLGYPDLKQLKAASSYVNKKCHDLCAAYRKCVSELREARTRFNATANRKTWVWYACGDGNKNSVAYRSKIAVNNPTELVWYRKYRFKYLYHELLDRKGERKRARAEIKEIMSRMEEIENQMFDRFGVPEGLRRARRKAETLLKLRHGNQSQSE